jgi:hypothetical protein
LADEIPNGSKEAKDKFRRRFDTSDAIILPMVQKGKVEETVLESLPQLAIQIINTWMLGQLQSIPPLTVFSISLSVLSLTNTMWYYAYWNLFRCMSIRDVPSTLALYNYKLSGVKDGAFSFAKASREVVEIELSDIEKMQSVTISGSVLNGNGAQEEQLDRLPTRNALGQVSELVRSSDAGVLSAVHSQSSRDGKLATAQQEIELTRLPAEQQAVVSKLQDEKRQMEAENSKLRWENKRLSQIEAEKRNLEAEKYHIEAEKRDMEAEISQLRREIQRLSSPALASEGASALGHAIRAPDASDINFDRDDRSSDSTLAHVARAAVALQSVTRGHLGRRLFRARRSETTARPAAATDADVSAAFHGVISSDLPHVARAAVALQSVTRGHLGRRLFRARRSEVALRP